MINNEDIGEMEEDEGPIMQLPFEILLHIFAYSKRYELDSVHQLVCQRWREVVNDTAMWKRNCSNEFLVENLYNPSKLDWKKTFLMRRKMWKLIANNRLITPSPAPRSMVRVTESTPRPSLPLPDQSVFFDEDDDVIEENRSFSSIEEERIENDLERAVEELNDSIRSLRDLNTPPRTVADEFNPLMFHGQNNQLVYLDQIKHSGVYVGHAGGIDSQAVGVIQSVYELGLFPYGDIPFFSYFEVKITNRGSRGFIGIGIAPRGYKNAEPGWRIGSFGYHGDDGRVYHNSGWGKAWGPTYTAGDVIGCLINTKTRSISFTKNGTNLGVAFSSIQLLQCEYCLTVGLHSYGEEISVNFGNEPFLFDVKDYAKETFLLETITEVRGKSDTDTFKDLLNKISRNEDIGNTPEMEVELRHLVKALTPLSRGELTEETPTERIQDIIRSVLLEDPISLSDEDDDQEYQQKDGIFTEAISWFGGGNKNIGQLFGINENPNDEDSELNISQSELRAIANGALEVDSPEGVNPTARIQFSQQYDEYFPSDESFGDNELNLSIEQ
eukprot:TRINITY_DN3138_c0_g2_i1.p1 TRINITY_DN3138_c0_g2~~TRINITY_DN3138_c0_g2_i1.p1  ORF type:complete len:555 (-),score=134.48 TRINITY_DN3138_c0_g2_i1:1172-2836(-)